MRTGIDNWRGGGQIFIIGRGADFFEIDCFYGL